VTVAYRRKEIQERVRRALVNLGVDDFEFGISRRASHQFVTFTVAGRTLTSYFAGSPGSRFSHKKACSDVRRLVREARKNNCN